MRGERIVIALAGALLVAAALGGLAAADNHERPYNGSNASVDAANWTEDRERVTLSNMTHYLSRVGTFVIGEEPDDPSTGPIFVGLAVAGAAAVNLGTSRAGLVASGTMGVVVAAALAGASGVGLLPRWLYGLVVMVVGLVLGMLYIRGVR